MHIDEAATTTEQAPETQEQSANEAEGEIKLSASALKARMDRHHKAAIRAQFGVDDPGALKAQLEELATLKAAQAKAKEAEMSEAERYRRDLEAVKAEHAKTREEFERANFESRVVRECARLGLQDIEYATYAYAKALAEAGEDADFDMPTWLATESKKRPHAFGVATTTVPATTATTTGATPAAPRAGVTQTTDATTMNASEFLRKYGVSPRRN